MGKESHTYWPRAAHALLCGIPSLVANTVIIGVVMHNHLQAQLAPQDAQAPTIALQSPVAPLHRKTCKFEVDVSLASKKVHVGCPLVGE